MNISFNESNFFDIKNLNLCEQNPGACVIASVALAALAFVALAYLTYHAAHRWYDKKIVSPQDPSLQTPSSRCHPEVHDTIIDHSAETSPFSTLPPEIIQYIFSYSCTPTMAAVNRQFKTKMQRVFSALM